MLAGAYPFLAEAGLGPEGLYIGQDAWSGSSFCYDPWVLYRAGVLTNPNCLLAGVVGKGKSTLAKSLATRSIAFGRKVYVPGDPKGEWSVVARAVGGQAIELGGGLTTRLNPLDEGPRTAGMDDAVWRDAVTARRRDLLRAVAEAALSRALHAVEATALFASLDAAVRDNTVPTLPHVVSALFDPAAAVDGSTVAQLVADGRQVAHALNRLVRGDLSGLFDGPSTTRFDTSLPMVSLDLSRIQGSDQLIALVMTCASAWM
ncbi:MAG: ATP-binding protein, partial [Jatrophihabitans sp.]